MHTEVRLMPARCQLAYTFQNAGVSRAERVAWERYFPELCGGARSVSRADAEPGPGRSAGRVRVDEDAFNWNCLWRRRFARAVDSDNGGCQRGGACRVVFDADDCADGNFAISGYAENGGAADADGLDSGDGSGQAFAGGVWAAASDLGQPRERCVARGNGLHVSDGSRVV